MLRRVRHFRLRSALVLIVLFSVVLGVRSSVLRVREQERRVLEELTAQGGIDTSFSVADTGPSYLFLPLEKRVVSVYIRADELPNKSALGKLRELESLRSIHLTGDCIIDTDLRSFSGLTKLEAVSISKSSISGRGIAALAKSVPRLRELFVSNTTLSDRDVVELLELTGLEVLDVSDTRISAEGIKRLAALPKLRELKATGTKIPAEISDAIRKERPTLVLAL